MAAETQWWRRHLAGAPTVLDLPIDHARPNLQSYRGRRLSQALDPVLAERLRTFAADPAPRRSSPSRPRSPG